MITNYCIKSLIITISAFLLIACGPTANLKSNSAGNQATVNWKNAQWKETNASHALLVNIPKPSGKIKAAVYSFKDMTGQYKSATSNSFSTAVTQGASAMLIKALKDSGWFIPVEREGLQNLLTERKIIRATLKQRGIAADIPRIFGANIILEGGIISYDTNLKTGGMGAKYFGIGASNRYQVDKITVSLRAVDINTSVVINSVTVTKTIYSTELTAGAFRFVKFKRLLELEAGFTNNEPVNLALLDAIETAVMRLIVSGIQQKHWQLRNKDQINHSTIKVFSDPAEQPAKS